MARPDYVICLECESEVEDFIWREGEIRRATCEVCGNNDPDAFSVPEEFDQDFEDEETEEEEEEEEEEELVEDYGDGFGEEEDER